MNLDQIWNQTDSYREPLCTQDEKGRALFSPLCNPNYQAPPSMNIEDTRKRTEEFDKNLCQIRPVEPRKAQVPQYDDSQSAFDWFKDPTYAQRLSMREKGVDDAAADTNPSLVLYHKLKTIEKVGGSLYQTM